MRSGGVLFFMDYLDLKQILKAERSNSTLARLPSTFFRDMDDYLFELRSSDELDITLYRNTVMCYGEIVERRLSKLSSTAYYTFFRLNSQSSVVSMEKLLENKPLNIHQMEIKFYENLIKNYYDTYSQFRLL